MDMTGERRIPAPREKVWQGLNDPVVLKASIPGCESLEKLSDTEFKATAAIKIGPIAARFTGKVALTEIDPPNGYRIGGEGQGGVAGFAKGGATVALTDIEADTMLRYAVQAQVGGKIAQLGARLIDATAKSMAEQFFTRFAAEVSAPAPVEAVSATDAVALAEPIAPPPPMVPPETPMPTGVATPVAPPPVAPPPVVMRPAPMPVQPASISMFSLLPKEPFGFPIIAWVGAAICFVIFILIFGSYL